MDIMFYFTVAITLSYFLGKKMGFEEGIQVGAKEVLAMLGEMPLENLGEGKVIPFSDTDQDDNGGNC